MKLATFRRGGTSAVALVDPDRGCAFPVDDRIGERVPSMLALVRRWDDLAPRLRPAGDGVPLGAVTLEAPLRPPRNVFCVGKNYREHAHEFARSGFDTSAKGPADAVPSVPIVFT